MNTDNLQRKDWLYYRGKFNAFPFQVEQITKKKIGYHAEPNDHRVYFLRWDEAEPIPLSKEFMDRNFSLNDYYQETHDIPGVYFYIVPKDKWTWNLVWDVENGCLSIEDDPLIRMKYVHELQHIFKLCGINKMFIL